MSVNLTINGVAYPFPVQGDSPPWGSQVTAWAQAVTGGMLQKAGGVFTLTADVDFGGSYGLKATKFSTRTANPATSGLLRLANNETAVAWRDAANSTNLELAVNALDQLTFNGVAIQNAASYTNNRAIVSNGSGQLTAATTTATEIGYVNGVTGSIQGQIDAITSSLTGYVPYSGATGDVDLGVHDLEAANVSVTGQLSSGTPDTMTVNGGVITSNIQANSDTLAVIESHTHNNSPGSASIIYHARSRGTNASPAAVEDGDTLGIFAAVGFDGTDYAVGGWITWIVDGTPGNNDMPTALIFGTTPDGANTPVERMRIRPTGAVEIAGLTASRALATNSAKELVSSSVTDTELGYVSGVTSGIQTQLNARTMVVARAANVDVANTNVETAVLSATIAGGSLGTNRLLRFTGIGKVIKGGNGFDITVRMKYGATTLATLIYSNSTDADVVLIDCLLGPDTSETDQHGSMVMRIRDDGSAGSFDSVAVDAGDSAEDSTVDKTFAVSVQFVGTNDTFHLYNGVLELV